MKREFWDDRFKDEEYAYGLEPSIYFKSVIDRLEPGSLLLPAEGEGRNAIYAAKKGWDVTAFDQSGEGRRKALELAKKEGVEIKYNHWNLQEFLESEVQSYDLVAMIYFHLPPKLRISLYGRIHEWVKPGGHLLIEGYSPEQVRNKRTSGGPQLEEMLFTCEQIQSELADDMQTVECQQLVAELSEGIYHRGVADMTWYLGQKERGQ